MQTTAKHLNITSANFYANKVCVCVWGGGGGGGGGREWGDVVGICRMTSIVGC